jgi:hydroxymethylglutaryl-CoA lyase
MPSLPTDVVLREVGLRDGLQSIQTILPTDRKIEWIRDAYAAGQRDIEVGSFVPACLLPQLADTAELVAYAKTLPDLCVSVLVPNSKTLIEGGIGTAFGCTIQGYFSQTDVLRCMQALLDAGADRVSIADTVGYAGPTAVRDLFEKARRIAGERFWRGHFHDTRGLGLANVYAALETGVARFDSTLAGIGGCPHAPGASGNVSSEDLAFMLADMGIETGIDIPALLALRAKVARWLEGETLHGALWLAGLPKTHAAPAALDA